MSGKQESIKVQSQANTCDFLLLKYNFCNIYNNVNLSILRNRLTRTRMRSSISCSLLKALRRIAKTIHNNSFYNSYQTSLDEQYQQPLVGLDPFYNFTYLQPNQKNEHITIQLKSFYLTLRPKPSTILFGYTIQKRLTIFF